VIGDHERMDTCTCAAVGCEGTGEAGVVGMCGRDCETGGYLTSDQVKAAADLRLGRVRACKMIYHVVLAWRKRWPLTAASYAASCCAPVRASFAVRARAWSDHVRQVVAETTQTPSTLAAAGGC